jgi:WD40 repeat protein
LTVSENILYSGGNDLEIFVWNISTKAKIDGYNGHTGEITCFTVEKEFLFSTSYDETVKIWNRDTGTLVQDFQGDIQQ